MKYEEAVALCSDQGIELLQKVIEEEAQSFLFRFKDKYDDNLLRAVAEQLTYRKKLLAKQPQWAQKGALCEGSLLEQSTPWAVALFRATLISGQRLLDGTGGMGVDTLALSRNFTENIYCEMDAGRAELFRYNKRLFNADDIGVVHQNSMTFLEQQEDDSFDWIFLDPARRSEGKRFIDLEQSLPNVIAYGPLLRQKSKSIAIKIAPAFDISRLITLIPDSSRIITISFAGEVREILVLIEKEEQTRTLEAVVIAASGEVVSHLISREKLDNSIAITSNIEGKYLFEPDGAIIKAGLIDRLALEYNLSRYSYNGVFLVGESDLKRDAFPGRVLRVVKEVSWQRKQIKRYLKEEGITKASVIRRNFPMAPEVLRKEFKLAESEKQFLIFTTNSSGKKVMINACRDL